MRIWPTKRRWKQIAIAAVAIVAIALIANGFMIWRTDARLQKRIDAIRASGNPASIVDLALEPIPPNENAAYHLERMAPKLDEFSKAHVQFLDNTPLGKAYETSLNREEYASKEQLDAIRQILDQYPEIDAGLVAAAACDRYGSMLDFRADHNQLLLEIIDDRTTRIRTLARFVNWRMEVLVQEGRADEAVQLGIQLLKVARLYNGEPLLINYLLGVAIRGIACHAIYEAVSAGSVTPDTLTALDQQFALLDDPQELARVLTTEQAFGISYVNESGVFAGEPLNPVVVKLIGWPMKSMFIDSLGVFDDLLPLTGSQWFEVRDRFTPDGRIDASAYGTMGELWMPGLLAAYSAHNRNLANIRLARIASALARYRQEHEREASGLDELALPTDATMDPFSGEPLKLKHTPDGWLIYTVMQNGIDDGGEFNEAQKKDDQGFAPRRRKQ